MKTKLLFFVLALFAYVGNIFASTKVGILYYNFDAVNLTAEVTYQYSNSTTDNYKGITTINIPSVISYNSQNYNVTSIGEKAFIYCKTLTSVTIPESIIEIGAYAFRGTKIESITIPSTITNIANFTFADCTELKEIIIPSNVRNIGANAFNGCRNLSSLTLLEGVETIEKRAFYGCYSLSVITIPESILSIGNDAFLFGADKYLSVVWNAINCADFTEESGGPFNGGVVTSFEFGSKVEHIPAFVCQDLLLVTSISIPNSVTSIGEGAFYNCKRATTLTIPEGVSRIGRKAFARCAALTTVTLPNSLRKIEKFTFDGCSDLKSINIGDGVTIIEDSVFCMSGVKSITFGSNIQYIGKPLGSLTSVTIKDLAAWCNVSFAEGSGYPKLGKNYNLYLNKSIVYDLEVPDGVSAINKYVFAGCGSIKSVSLPNTVVSIEPFAFGMCTNLQSLSMGANVTTIGDHAFDGADLSTIVIPDKVATIGAHAFETNSGMCVLRIGKNVSSIGEYAFMNCKRLTSVTSKSVIPPSMGDGVFLGVDCSSVPLYVRKESVGLYKEADQWKDFLNVDTIVSQAFSVIFLDWDGTPLASVEVGEEDSVTAPIIPTREGYTFIGWDKDLSIINSNVTATALYKINYYKVDFLDWDGTVIKSDSVEYLSCAIAPENPSREGYTFTSWDKTVNKVAQDTTITALYDINFYPVVLLGHDGKLLSKQIVAYKHAAEQPEVPLREGYSFVGWSTNIESIVDSTYAIARYNKIGGTVTYLSEEGDVIASENVDLHLPAAPVIAGKSFKGWFTESADSENGMVLRATYTFDNPTTRNNIIITPTSNSADMSFPFITGALTYELVIRNPSGNVIFKTMSNYNGQLLGIAFAPSRNRDEQQATQLVGFHFAVEGLNASTIYNYEFVAYDEKDDIIETLSGSFTTTADTLTNINNQKSQSSNRKYIESGHLFIDNSDRTYDANGWQVR